MAILDISGLNLRLNGRVILNGINLSLDQGRVTALVGRSGSGKSMTARTIIRLPPSGAETAGSIRFEGRDLLPLPETIMTQLRGRAIGMVFQDPAGAFDPLMTIGDHVAEPLGRQGGLNRRDTRDKARQMLERVGFPPDIDAFARYPHEVSGGQRQRAMIAAALAPGPKVLLADEPTTALDVTTEAALLVLLRRLAREDGLAVLLITHDLPAAMGIADDIALIENGQIIERTETKTLTRDTGPPRLRGLLQSAVPTAASVRKAIGLPLVTLKNLSRTYRGPAGETEALANVSLTLHKGECLGLVGGSGSGKSTLARIVAGLDKPTTGEIVWPGAAASSSTRLQMVFQDPMGAFNPRWTVSRSVAEPLFERSLSASDKSGLVASALTEAGLDPAFADRYPHQLSGGQAQRAAIARAIIVKPCLLILDEPVSALDVAIRGQILDVLARLRADHDLAMLFITHDLGVALAITDRIAVMDQGRIVEEGTTKAILTVPNHPTTQALVSASPGLKLQKLFAPSGSGR